MFTTIEVPESGATPQWVYDRVKAHLLKQGRKALQGNRCAYRGDENTACAAGCLIRDDLYQPTMEGLSAAGDRGVWNAIAESIGLPHDGNDKTGRLISSLQSMHDTREPEQWPLALSQIAMDNGLQP